MAIYKEIKGNEFYLWINGNLVYKKWLDTGASKVFDVFTYDKYTYTSFSDLDLKPTPPLIHVKTKLKMKSTDEGGRKTGFLSGYRPNHVFEYNEIGTFVATFIGDIQFDEQEQIMPGEEKIVTVRFLFWLHVEKYLQIGRKWWIHEAGKCIGEAEMLEITLPTENR